MDPVHYEMVAVRLAMVCAVIESGELEEFRSIIAKKETCCETDRALNLSVIDKLLSAKEVIHQIRKRAETEQRLFSNAPKN